jgi:endonuclease/exonuclease/phosphatase family metal-dependent hydrolase
VAVLLSLLSFCHSQAMPSLEIDCLTWNVAQQTDSGVISSLFAFSNADVIWIALQEIELSANLVDGNASDRFSSICSALQSGFRSDYSYAYGQNLGGVAVFLFFRKASVFELSVGNSVLVPHVADSVTAGKASICVQISVIFDGEERFVTLIGSHFECREEEYLRRNSAWRTVIGKMPQSNYTILAGDLNYRIEVPREKALELIENKDVKGLLKYDQLERTKRENEEFAVFKEGTIEFFPTYKFDLGSDCYDTSAKQRTPSYTDRILIAGPSIPLILDYRALPERLSDHRPVRARFQLP